VQEQGQVIEPRNLLKPFSEIVEECGQVSMGDDRFRNRQESMKSLAGGAYQLITSWIAHRSSLRSTRCEVVKDQTASPRCIVRESPENLPPLARIAPLGEIGPEASRAVPVLKALLEDVDLDIRRSAAEALCRIETPSPTGIAVLVRLPESGADESALDSLAGLGPKAKDAIPALLRILRQEPERVPEVARALRRIDPEPATKYGLP
jgi:hypothetical protein